MKVVRNGFVSKTWEDIVVFHGWEIDCEGEQVDLELMGAFILDYLKTKRKAWESCKTTNYKLERAVAGG